MKSEENLVFRENTLQIFAQNLVENVAADAMAACAGSASAAPAENSADVEKIVAEVTKKILAQMK